MRFSSSQPLGAIVAMLLFFSAPKVLSFQSVPNNNNNKALLLPLLRTSSSSIVLPQQQPSTTTSTTALFQSDISTSASERLTTEGGIVSSSSWSSPTIPLRNKLPLSLSDTNKYLTSIAINAMYGSQRLCRTSMAVCKSLLVTLWWCMPLVLCLVPIYTMACHNSLPTTPSCWKLVNVDYLWHGPQANFIVSCFLGSNVFYFMAGIYLLYKFPANATATAAAAKNNKALVRSIKHSEQPEETTSTSLSNRISSNLSYYMSSLFVLQQKASMVKPSRHTWLGIWTLLAGSISTVFHSVQTFCTYQIAEGYCYLDHGVAGAAILYFWRTCGRPQKPALALGGAGLIALSLPLKPGYAWLHSTWHFLSAACAVAWAIQGKAVRRAQLENYFATEKQQQQQQREL